MFETVKVKNWNDFMYSLIISTVVLESGVRFPIDKLRCHFQIIERVHI